MKAHKFGPPHVSHAGRTVCEILTIKIFVTLKYPLKVIEGHPKWYQCTRLMKAYTIGSGRFLRQTHRFRDIDDQKFRDLEMTLEGHPRSSRVVPLNSR